MKAQRLSLQAGLTLIEMVIALSVIVLVLVLTTMGLNQDKQRAESLEAKLQLVRAAVLRFQTDLPCGPATLSALTMREAAAVGLCGDSNNLNNWHGPYIDSGSIYLNAGDTDLSNILPGASLAITQEVVGGTIYTILKVSEISDEMRSALVALCSDDCTPYKSITGDADTTGILVSQLSLKAFDPNGDFVALGVTATTPAGPGAVVVPPMLPSTWQPVLTLPASPFVLPPVYGPATPLTVMTPSTASTASTPPGLAAFVPSGVTPPPPPPPAPPPPAPPSGGMSAIIPGNYSGQFIISATCDGDVYYPMRATVDSKGTAVVFTDGWVLVGGSGDGSHLESAKDANTCTTTLDAAGNGGCQISGYADNGVAFLGWLEVLNSKAVRGQANIQGASCGR